MVQIIMPIACIPCRYGVHRECEGPHCECECPDNKPAKQEAARDEPSGDGQEG